MNRLWPGDHAAVTAACQEVPSPALLVFPDLVEANIRHMVSLSGSTERLRPHLKTTKMPAVVRLLLKADITRFKCATLAEMLMALENGASDILLACQPVGPNLGALASVANAHPGARLSTLVDDAVIARQLADACREAHISLGVYIDLDCGMHRTGIDPGPSALALRDLLNELDSLEFRGWHVYDGHLRQTDLEERRAAVRACFEPVWQMIREDSATTDAEVDSGLEIIAGGTPTFAIHATDPRVICSPGTCVFWDAGYASIVPDLPFQPAAILLTRILSRCGNRLTLDLGHKAVAAENPLERRVVLPALPDARFLAHSEEHLVLETPLAGVWQTGDALLGIPWHICPTVALYDCATTMVANRPDAPWPIPARKRYPAAALEPQRGRR